MINIATTAADKRDKINIRGTTVKDFELSRASRVFTQKEKIPESRLKSLKSDSQRKADLVLKKRHDSKEGDPTGFFDKKAEEFQDILKSIE